MTNPHGNFQSSTETFEIMFTQHYLLRESWWKRKQYKF